MSSSTRNGLTAVHWALSEGHIKIANMLSSLDTDWGTLVSELT